MTLFVECETAGRRFRLWIKSRRCFEFSDQGVIRRLGYPHELPPGAYAELLQKDRKLQPILLSPDPLKNFRIPDLYSCVDCSDL